MLKPKVVDKKRVSVLVPKIDEEKCINCGKCVLNCNFNALAKANNNTLLFEKLCHSCGLCSMSCPVNAILEVSREIGDIDIAYRQNQKCISGVLDINEPMGVSIIKELKNITKNDKNVVFDSPPGTSCNVVATIKDIDFAVLVAEPTEFGLHDLKMAVELLHDLNIYMGIVINKWQKEVNIIEKFALEKNIEILGKIPYDKEIAKLYSNGELLIENDNYRSVFMDIITNIERGAVIERDNSYKW